MFLNCKINTVSCNCVFQIGVPVYCMAINLRRFQLVCGVNGGIRVYALDESK